MNKLGLVDVGALPWIETILYLVGALSQCLEGFIHRLCSCSSIRGELCVLCTTVQYVPMHPDASKGQGLLPCFPAFSLVGLLWDHFNLEPT